MGNKLDLLFPGFPGKSSFGFLGWSSAVLIKSQGKNILFDTGNIGMRRMLLAKLAEHGVSPQDIDYVILSHLHFDHSINIPLFTKAVFLFSKRELEYDDGLKPEGIEKYLSDPSRSMLLDEEKEIFEDISFINTPGHSPGCISLIVKTDEDSYVLAADAVKNITELKQEKPDMTMNMSQSVVSIQKIKKAGALIIPGHDHILQVEENGNIRRLKNLEVVIELPAGIKGGVDERYVLSV